jgi:hypothetical protein
MGLKARVGWTRTQDLAGGQVNIGHCLSLSPFTTPPRGGSASLAPALTKGQASNPELTDSWLGPRDN